MVGTERGQGVGAEGGGRGQEAGAGGGQHRGRGQEVGGQGAEGEGGQEATAEDVIPGAEAGILSQVGTRDRSRGAGVEERGLLTAYNETGLLPLKQPKSFFLSPDCDVRCRNPSLSSQEKTLYFMKPETCICSGWASSAVLSCAALRCLIPVHSRFKTHPKLLEPRPFFCPPTIFFFYLISFTFKIENLISSSPELSQSCHKLNMLSWKFPANKLNMLATSWADSRKVQILFTWYWCEHHTSYAREGGFLATYDPTINQLHVIHQLLS